MKNERLMSLLMLLLTFGLGSCDVDQTKEAKLPDVDVDVQSGQLPSFDVDWADVDVGTRTEKITVPTVKVVMEEIEVEVPYINVDMPNAGAKEELTIAVEAEVKNESHKIEITEVYASKNRLFVISKLMPTGKDLQDEKMRISDRLVLNAPEDLDVKHYIIGKRPAGQFNKQYSYISNKKAIINKLKNGKTIYKK